MRFAPNSRQFTYRFAVLPISSILRVEHVVQDFCQTGVDGSFATFYVNPWKWSLENVAEDDGRGETLDMMPL